MSHAVLAYDNTLRELILGMIESAIGQLMLRNSDLKPGSPCPSSFLVCRKPLKETRGRLDFAGLTVYCIPSTLQNTQENRTSETIQFDRVKFIITLDHRLPL